MTEQQFAQMEALNQLSSAHTAGSRHADMVLNMLEGADGSLGLRDLALKVLLMDTNTALAGLPPPVAPAVVPAVNSDEFERMHSVKEKLAYLISLRFAPTTNIANTLGVQDRVQQLINDSINTLETTLLNNTAPSENFLIRHAAVANIPMTLISAQRAELISIGQAIGAHATNVWEAVIASKMHFGQETDAQRFVKVDEAINMLTAHGHVIPADLMTRYTTFTNGLWGAGNKLTNLDKAYKWLSNAINTLWEAGRHGYESFWSGNSSIVPTKAQQAKLEKALVGLDTKTQSFLTDTQIESGESIHIALQNLKVDATKFRVEYRKAGFASETEFDRLFMSTVAYRRLEKAKKHFDQIKKTTFGTHEKAFEQSLRTWRGKARERIIDLVNSWAAPHTSEWELLSSYLEKFPSIFYDEDDRNAAPGSPRIPTEIRQALDIALQHRTGLDANDRATMTNFILDQGRTVSDFFYNDRDPFAEEKGRGRRFLDSVSQMEQARVSLRDGRLWKWATAVLRTSESLITKAARLTGKVSKFITSKMLSVSKSAGEIVKPKIENTGKNWFTKWFQAVAKRAIRAPLYVLYAGAKGAQGVSYGIDKGVDLTQWTVSGLYKGTIDVTKAGSGDSRVTHAYQALTKILDFGTGLVASGSSNLAEWGEWQLDAGQKRQVVHGILDASARNEELRYFMEAGNLAGMTDMRIGTSLWDDLGNISSVRTSANAPQVQLLITTAETAVKAYESAPITTLAEITAAEALEIVATNDVSAVTIEGDKVSFNARITSKKDTIAKAKPEATVAVYEAAPLTTMVDIAAAEALKTWTDNIVLSLVDGKDKADLQTRITNRTDIIRAAKVRLEVIAAEALVIAYEAAPLTTMADIAAAEALKTWTDNIVLALTDAVGKANLERRINTRTVVIATAKAHLENATRIADANAAVLVYETTPINTLLAIAFVERLKDPAVRAKDLVVDPVQKTAFENRITARDAVITRDKISLRENELIAANTHVVSVSSTLVFSPVATLSSTTISVGDRIVLNDTLPDNLVIVVREKSLTPTWAVFTVDFLQNEAWRIKKRELNQKMTIKNDWVEFPDRKAFAVPDLPEYTTTNYCINP